MKAGDVLTAHELAADWEWVNAGLSAVPVHGRPVRWEVLEYIGERIRAGRVIQVGDRLATRVSWPRPDARYRLVLGFDEPGN